MSFRYRDILSQRDRHTQTENVRENVRVGDRDKLSQRGRHTQKDIVGENVGVRDRDILRQRPTERRRQRA